jgi:hypothetical protein
MSQLDGHDIPELIIRNAFPLGFQKGKKFPPPAPVVGNKTRKKSSDLKYFRERTDELMSQLDKHDIPVLILSAGLGDLIHEVLTQYKVILFIDNFFDDTGTAVYTRYERFGKLGVPSDSSLPT